MHMNSSTTKLGRFTLIILLSGLTTWTMGQVKTTSEAIVVEKTTTNQSAEFQGPIGIGIAPSFVIEDDIMQSDGENGGNTNGGKTGNTTSVNANTDIKNTGFITSSLHVLAKEIKVYPVPANTFANIDLGQVKVKGINVINSLGQKVYTQTVEQQFIRLDISNLQTGIYFIQMITSDNQMITKNIMVN